MKSIIFLFVILLVTRLNVNAQSFETSKIGSNTFYASSFINDNEGWLSDIKGQLWHTGNGGQTWDSSMIEKYFITLDFIDSLIGFGITSDGVNKTIDGGHTWELLTMPGSIGRSLYFFDNNMGFVSGSKVIYKTTDGGNTWSTISTEEVFFVDYFFINSSVGIAAAYDDEQNKCLWRTTDGGSTWINVFSQRNYFIESIQYSNENSVWAAGYYESPSRGKQPAILHSTDGGTTWENVYRNTQTVGMGESLTDIRFKNEQQGIAIADEEYDVYTIDGGTTWNLTHDTDTPGISPWNYKTLGGYNNIYIAGKDGYITKW